MLVRGDSPVCKKLISSIFKKLSVETITKAVAAGKGKSHIVPETSLQVSI